MRSLSVFVNVKGDHNPTFENVSCNNTAARSCCTRSMCSPMPMAMAVLCSLLALACWQVLRGDLRWDTWPSPEVQWFSADTRKTNRSTFQSRLNSFQQHLTSVLSNDHAVFTRCFCSATNFANCPEFLAKCTNVREMSKPRPAPSQQGPQGAVCPQGLRVQEVPVDVESATNDEEANFRASLQSTGGEKAGGAVPQLEVYPRC